MTELVNCLEVLAGENPFGNVTEFAQGSGKIYLIDFPDCWADVAEDIEYQLASSQKAIAALEAL